MKAEQVLDFLQKNVHFFEDHADALAQIYIPHPHGGRAIPIAERQIVSLREKNRILESKLSELVQYGEENDAISERLHQLILGLTPQTSFDDFFAALYSELAERFNIPHIALRIWQKDDIPNYDGVEFNKPSHEAIVFAESLTMPYCIDHPMFDTLQWFGQTPEPLRSFAYAPLRNEHAFGLIALGSFDEKRFYPEMGTLYLRRLSEYLSLRFQQLLVSNNLLIPA